MSRVLYVATSDAHLKAFHVPYLEWLTSEGHIVDIVAERRKGLTFDCVRQAYWMSFPRKVAAAQHWTSFRELRSIIEDGDYDVVHCHTPIPSALTRLASRRWRRRRGGKVLYTAHGFHFYRGAPLKNWLMYYPIEWLLSAFTDAILTINHEDYGYANRWMRHKDSYLLPGIGVRQDRFRPVSGAEKQDLRRELGFDEDAFLLLYTAEFIPRKNHRFLIEAGSELVRRAPNAQLVFAGTGQLMDEMQAEAHARGLARQVRFLGFRTDIEKIAAIVDVGVSSSRHEGLPIAPLEQMLCEVPVVATDDRGHREFIEHGVTGFIFEQGDHRGFLDAALKLRYDSDLRATLGKAARERALHFSIDKALEAHRAIYAKYLRENGNEGPASCGR